MKFIFSNVASVLRISGGMLSWDAMVMNCKSMATPGSKGQESSRNVADSTEKLDPQEHREFRNLSVHDRTTFRHCLAVRRKSRERRQRCVLNFHWVGKLDDVMHVTVDAEWAGKP